MNRPGTLEIVSDIDPGVADDIKAAALGATLGSSEVPDKDKNALMASLMAQILGPTEGAEVKQVGGNAVIKKIGEGIVVIPGLPGLVDEDHKPSVEVIAGWPKDVSDTLTERGVDPKVTEALLGA
jgi:hypothetical protein